jgi:CRP/FNR family transcriptional regulator, dissimilatory nitrate respiration regulator
MNINPLDMMQEISENRILKKGEFVFLQGSEANSIFKVNEGEVHLYRYSQFGKKILLHRAYSSDYFAEASLNSSHYHCTAKCIKDTEIQVINADKMLKLLNSSSEFSSAWISILSSEVRRQRANVERLNINSAEERLKHYLMSEADARGRIILKGTVSDLADILGLSRETLYRVISKLEKKGELERSDTCFKLTQKQPYDPNHTGIAS